MLSSDVQETISGYIYKHFHFKSNLENKSFLLEDIGIDSLQRVEMLIWIDDEFNIDTGNDDTELEELETFGELCELVHSRLTTK